MTAFLARPGSETLDIEPTPKKLIPQAFQAEGAEGETLEVIVVSKATFDRVYEKTNGFVYSQSLGLLGVDTVVYTKKLI